MAALSLIFYGINFVFCLIGGTMLGVGIWMAVDTEDAEESFAEAGLNEDLYWTSVYFMITIGCLVLIVSFIGMVGASSPKKFKGVLFGYIGVVCVILILELILIIMTGVFWDSVGSDVGTRNEMMNEVKNVYIDEESTDNVSVKWNNMQMDWGCCGVDNYNDWDGSSYQAINFHEVPWTCCVMRDGGRLETDVVNILECRKDAANNIAILDYSQYLHTRGCYSRMNDIFEENAIIMIALTITFFAIEVGGLVIAFLLIRGGD